MEHWLSRSHFSSPRPVGDASQSDLLKWPRDSARHPSVEMSQRNLYWVPVRRKHNAAEETTISTVTKRQNIPKLDTASTAGVIAGVVLFVVIIMAAMVFLIWRNSRYQKKANRLRREAEEAAKSSDVHQEMEMSSDRSTGVTHGSFGHGTIEGRDKAAGNEQIRGSGDPDQLRRSYGTTHDAQSFSTAAV
ncbi:hypothetical protein SCARD494_10110 [Seiridium cardinale]